MYRTCLFCSRSLGGNPLIAAFPVGERLAYDAARGRLWVVCPHCARWNLTAVEERWEAIEECERLFRRTPFRYSTGEVGLARIGEGLDLIRIGRALRPEIAAWRYGRELLAPGRRSLGAAAGSLGARMAARGSALVESLRGTGERYAAGSWLRLALGPGRVVAVIARPDGDGVLIRRHHLEHAELIRPEARRRWRLLVHHECGDVELSGAAGLRAAGKLLAALNGFRAGREQVRSALSKLQDACDPDGYFARVADLALRTAWGRHPEGLGSGCGVVRSGSDAERLALYLTSRAFWARGAIGSEPRTVLARVAFVDRLALEMAANEDAERRALRGELAELERAWREAEEIAAIADGLLDDAGRAPGAPWALLRFRPGTATAG